MSEKCETAASSKPVRESSVPVRTSARLPCRVGKLDRREPRSCSPAATVNEGGDDLDACTRLSGNPQRYAILDIDLPAAQCATCEEGARPASPTQHLIKQRQGVMAAPPAICRRRRLQNCSSAPTSRPFLRPEPDPLMPALEQAAANHPTGPRIGHHRLIARTSEPPSMRRLAIQQNLLAHEGLSANSKLAESESSPSTRQPPARRKLRVMS